VTSGPCRPPAIGTEHAVRAWTSPLHIAPSRLDVTKVARIAACRDGSRGQQMSAELSDPKDADPLTATSDFGEATDSHAEATGWDCADAMIDEWGLQSFPASDPPSNW
jgi:hypothetical protein